MTDLLEAPPAMRLRQYRAMAAAARKQAGCSSGQEQNCYLRDAEHWERLAADLETQLIKFGS